MNNIIIGESEVLDLMDDLYLRENGYKKFVESFTFGDGEEEYEVLTESGWVDIKSVGKTIPYEVWNLKLANGYVLRCADKHIVMKSGFIETYVMDLVEGDLLMTDTGLSRVVSVTNTMVMENMYDLQLPDESAHTYYTGGILSHNSIWLANIAAAAVLNGHNVAVISLEMSESKYVKRLGANIINIKMDEYKKAAADSDFIKHKINKISGGGGLILPGNLIIKEFPTSTASSIDIENYLKRTEEKRGIKFKVVIIDYLNIMKNWRNPNSENTYMKIKQIAEDVRAMAQVNNWAIISVTQVKQSAFDSSDMSSSAASESSALVATVDLMFGIIQDPMMLLNKKYKLKVLANRDEGYTNCSKMVDIDYSHMRLMEDSSPIIEGGI